MYEKLNEKFQESIKPMTALMEINIRVLETLAEKQTSFYKISLNDGLAYTETLSSQTDLPGILQVNKEFSEDFQTKMLETSKEVYSVFTEAQDKASEILKSGFTSGSVFVPDVMKAKPKSSKAKTVSK